MKKWLKKLIPISLLLIVIALVISIGVGYFNFISQQVSADSEKHLKEVYNQVNHSFLGFIERNWEFLDSGRDYFSLVNDNSDSEQPDEIMLEFIASKKEFWEFSDFYFLNAEKNYLTPDGATGVLVLENAWDSLWQEEKVMAGEKIFGEEVTIFAIRTPKGIFSDFEYEAIAISYTNTDIARSLNSDAFNGNSKTFIIHSDGSVLLSTRTDGGVFSNYLTYLNNFGLDEKGKEQILSDLKEGKEGYLQCELGIDEKQEHCIVYLPVGYQDFYLLSDVPQTAVSEGFLLAQRATMRVLLIIFTIVGVALLAFLFFRIFSQSRKNKTELQYRERMFDMLSTNIDDIFIMLDPESQRVDYLSPNVERLLGLKLSDVKQDIRTLIRCAVDQNIIIPKDVLEQIPLNGNRFWECEYMHQSTGERRWYRVTVYNMSIQSIKKYIIVMSDRTMEQQMNQKLQEALDAAKSANEAKSNFLSNMSHDIRTPMNAIVGFSVLLEKDADQPDKVREYTRKITASSQHLLSLINDVLDMSKIESGKTSLNVDKFSLPKLLEELNIILMPQAKAKNQSFTIQLQGKPPEQILGDKLRLNQILLNLLSNAIKYTPVGGKIEFIICELPQPAQQYVKLRFIVRDNGIGMSEEFQKEIFMPFSREISSVTNKIQGTGLGMAITKNLVDLMGGIIQVQSKPGEGSVFTVEMSFLLPEQEESESWYRHAVTRMLVADDEIDICLNIREMMHDSGVDVSFVTDGAAAVELAVEANRRGEDFNVILLDWRMPGQDGVETARLIREKVGSHVPILVLTSYDWSDIETEAREAGINAFMPKPFFVSTFWQTIKPLFVGQEQETPVQTEADDALKDRLLLIAEDNELNAEILTEMLDMEGAKCELAVNGLEAYEMFLHSEPGHYDMILMDVQMPVMNGYEATRKIRASSHPQAEKIPIVAMTANTFAEDVRNAFDAGMNGHLAKPIDMKAVKKLIAELLKK